MWGRRFFIAWLAIAAPALAGNIAGTVSRGEQPVANADVLAVEAATLCLAGVSESDASGFYLIEDLPDGAYLILVSQGSLGLARYHGNGSFADVSSAEPVEIEGSGTVLQDVAFPAGATVSGAVHAGGRSLAGARAALIDPISLRPLSAFSVPVDPKVGYRIEGAPAGRWLVGLFLDGADGTLASAYHPNAVAPETARQVALAEGETRLNVNINLAADDLGTLEIALAGFEPDVLGEIVLTDAAGRVHTRSALQAETDIAIAPGTYQIDILFERQFLDVDDVLPKIVEPGGTTRANYTLSRGGVVSGTVALAAGLLTTAPVYVEAIDFNSGRLAASVQASSSLGGDYHFELTGLPPAGYLIRAWVDGNTGFTPFAISPAFHEDAVSAQDADPVFLGNGETVTDIALNLTRGAEIQGSLQFDGNLLPTIFGFIYAFEMTSGELFQGIYSSRAGLFSIGNLPPGEFLAVFNPGALPNAADRFSGAPSFLSSPLFGCANVTPSFFRNADEPGAAEPVQLVSGQVRNANYSVGTGGGFVVRVSDATGDYALQRGLLGVFRDERLVMAASILDGAAQFTGLTAGDYVLKLSPYDLDADGNLEPASPSATDPADLFSGDGALTYEPAIQAVDGAFSLVEWRAPLTVAGQTGGGGPADESRLVYPWISNRQNQFESVLVANNYCGEAIQAVLTATRANGESETVVRALPAFGFLEEKASTLFPGLGSGGGYSVALTAPTTKIRGVWATNNLQSQSGASPSQGAAVRLPMGAGAPNNSRVGREMLFGYLPLSDNLISAPVVVNVSDATTDVTLRFFDATGTMVASTTLQNLPPFAPFAQVANDLVPAGSGDVVMIAEAADGLVTGVSFVFNSVFFETAIGNATAIDSAGLDTGVGRLVYPWISNRADQFESILVANNYGELPVLATLTARRNSDPLETQTVQRRIEAGGFLRAKASELFPDLGSGDGYAVELTAPASKLAGVWATNNLQAASGQSPSLGVAVNAAPASLDRERAGEDLIFGYLPVDEAFISAPVLVNLGDAPVDVTLRFFDQQGNALADAETTLADIAPSLPFAALANQLAPGFSGSLAMTASADGQPITGVAFVFNTVFFEPAIGNASSIELCSPAP